jgi:hypothetical protein
MAVTLKPIDYSKIKPEELVDAIKTWFEFGSLAFGGIAHVTSKPR